jgi:DnaJ family protein C protein 9
MEEIPHSQHHDEERFITIVNSLIESNTLKSTPTWKKSSTDEKARTRRKDNAEKEGKDAEKHAKELGIWDELYAGGKKGKRKSDARDEPSGEDGLAALILKRQKSREGELDRLAEKYRKIEEEERAKKRGKGKKGKKEESQDGPPVRLAISRVTTRRMLMK